MNENMILALGFFDGVHRGHQALLQACIHLSGETNAVPAAITFQNHPKSLLSASPPSTINTLGDRERLLQTFGMKRVIALPVTEKVMSTSWEEFLKVLVARGARGFVCGDDFRFGYQGQGDPQKLWEFCNRKGFPCVVLPEQTLDGTRISSTHIRRLLEAGDMEEAVRFMGHPHILTGSVVHGRGLGHTLGVPTANLHIPDGVVVPRYGVYAALCRVDGRQYPAVTNIGVRPTVSGEGVTVEPWLLGYDGSLYGREITLEIHAFLRPETRFGDLAALKAQIERDRERATELLNRISNGSS